MKRLLHRSQLLAIPIFLAMATIASAQVFYDASEGGWVDKKNNLVWGLDYTYFTTSAPNGSTGFQTPWPVDWPTAQNMAADYPALLLQYGWTDASNVAAYWQGQGLGWRQPTVTEASAAYKAGFLSRIYAYYQTPRWTSSAKTKKGVVVAVYVIDLLKGVELNIANPGFPLFVRPYR